MNFITEDQALLPRNCIDEPALESCWPVLICLLGNFHLLTSGKSLELHNATKTKALLARLAIEKGYCLSRDAILHLLWPESDTALASQSLNSLVHHLRKLLSDKIGGEPPILLNEDCYRLNVEAGIGVDADLFKAFVKKGEQQARTGDFVGSTESFQFAADLYHGDLCAGTDTQSLIEAEYLRATYLSLLSKLADHCYNAGNVTDCLNYAHELLSTDPCREDAHRLVMRCYVHQGERTQALRQYRLCEAILRSEFEIAPEAATTALFNLIRCNPARI
jgi:DNA-binding SARP family transcriptional activator